jgi:hypothetical protein
MFSGYVTMAYMWLRQAVTAADKLDNGGADSMEFYRTKIETAEFYYERMLPRAQTHASSMLSSPKNLMQTDPENLSFID